MNLLEIVTKWVADTTPIDKAIDDTATKAETRMGRVGGAVQKGIGAGAKTLAAGGAVLFGAATKGAIDLQNATLDFQAATGATADEAAAAGESINRLFGSNITTMGEASGVLAALKTNMGLTGQEAEDAAGRILDFAKVTGQDAVQAVGALDDLTDTYNLNAAQQADVLDKLVASQQKYGGSVTDNQSALVKLGPALQAANLGYDDGVGLLNLFANAGIDASKAPAALTKALSKVKSPAELQKLIDDIRNTEDPFLRAQKASDLFGAKAGPGLANALSKGGLDTFKVSMDEAAGSVSAAADTIDSKLGNQITLALNKAQSALAGFGEQLGPAVTGLASLASLGAPLVKGLIGGLLPALAGIAAPLAAGLSGLFAAAVPIAMAALPVLLVAGIVAAIVFLANNPQIVDQVIHFVEGLVQTIVDALGHLPEVLGPVLASLPGMFLELVPKIGAIWVTITSRIARLVLDLVVGLAGLILSLPGRIVGLLPGVFALFLTMSARLRGLIGSMVGAIVGFILSIPGRVASFVGSLIGLAGQAAAGLRARITAGVAQVVATILAIPGRVASWVGSIAGQAATMAGQLVSTIQNAIGRVVGFFLAIPGRIAAIGGRIVSGIINGMASLPGRLADTVRRAFSNLHIDIGPFHISSSGVTIDLPHIDFPHFAVGTPFVPADMLAVVHKGEAIIPAAYNPFASGAPQAPVVQPGGGGGGGDTYQVQLAVTGVLRAETPSDLTRPLQALAASGAISNPRHRRRVEVPTRA